MALYVRGSLLLTENEVVEFVCSYLVKNNYEINQYLSTTQTGIDIIATDAKGAKCYIEAKGATSSKPSSSRYGKEFNKSQVKSHIGMALVAAFKILNEYPNAESFIALPNNVEHKSLVKAMRKPLLQSGVKILLVNKQGVVQRYI